jgi:hypothetical protein
VEKIYEMGKKAEIEAINDVPHVCIGYLPVGQDGLGVAVNLDAMGQHVLLVDVDLRHELGAVRLEECEKPKELATRRMQVIPSSTNGTATCESCSKLTLIGRTGNTSVEVLTKSRLCSKASLFTRE